MNKRTILIVAFVVALAGMLVTLLILIAQTQTSHFTGKITSEDINCGIADGPTVIYVDYRKITLDPGNIGNRGAIGSVSEDLQACNNFDHSSLKRGKFGLPATGQPDGGEDLIGRNVEVNAHRSPDGSLSLVGSNSYYVKTIKESN